jgi:hypothetical protein
VSVAQVLSTTPLNVSFKRALVGGNWDKWLRLVESILMVHLNDLRDSFRWTGSRGGHSVEPTSSVRFYRFIENSVLDESETDRFKNTIEKPTNSVSV